MDVEILIDIYLCCYQVRFLLLATLVIIVGWYLNHRYHIGWLSLIVGGLFLYGYLHTYLECNRVSQI